jgi:hypothetical protein
MGPLHRHPLRRRGHPVGLTAYPRHRDVSLMAREMYAFKS